jgi:hypothetical protein
VAADLPVCRGGFVMRARLGRWLVVGAMLGAADCADGAAPPVESHPAKLWTGKIDVHEGQLFEFAVSSDGNTLARQAWR